MTFKYNNVYIKDTEIVVGKNEKEGPLKKYFSNYYDDFYMNEKTWEQAEMRLVKDTIFELTKRNKVDLIIAGDLLNQLSASSFAASEFDLPFMGIYNACATSVEGLAIAANFIEAKFNNNILVNVSSHNNAAEKQFRYPVEYGGPKPKCTTFTVTGSAGALVSNEPSEIKIESATIGKVTDYGIKDAYEIGAVMAPAAASVINDHLKDLNRDISYYDLVLTGDLGECGKRILKELIKLEYGISLKNYNDTATMIYDIKKQSVYSGGSGPACAPLVTYTYIFDEMRKGNLNKVLLVATGSLHSTTSVNQNQTIPAIAHAISLEVKKWFI